MARIRTIKPEFWTSEDLSETSEPARLLAIGLLNHADDEGYFKAHESLIKAVVFPLNEPSVSIHECLMQLSNADYLRVFEGSDGKRYGQILNFQHHQRVNRPTESKIRPLDTGTDVSLHNHTQFSEPSSPEGKGREGNREQGTGSREVVESQQPDLQAIFDYWCQVMGKTQRTKFTKDRKTKIQARLREGYTVEDIKTAIDQCAASEFHQGKNDQGTLYNDLTLICRSGSQLEFFMDRVAQKAPSTGREPETLDQFKERNQKQAERVMNSGLLDDLPSERGN